MRTARLALALPVHHHAGLREREGHERADGKERDQPVGDAAEDDEQQRGERDQHINSPGVEQPPAAQQKDVGHVVVEGDGAGEARKISKRGVGRERQHQQHRADGEVVEPAVAHHRARQHGEHALVAGAVGIGGGDAVSAAEQRDAGQQHGQQDDDDGQRDLGVLARVVAEGHHAVAHRFHAGHGRAAGREDFQQQPQADGGRGRGHAGSGVTG